MITLFAVWVVVHSSLAVAQMPFAHKPYPVIDYAVFSAVLDGEYRKNSDFQVVVGDTTDSQVLYSVNFRYAGNEEFGGKLTTLVSTPSWLNFLKSVERIPTHQYSRIRVRCDNGSQFAAKAVRAFFAGQQIYQEF